MITDTSMLGLQAAIATDDADEIHSLLNRGADIDAADVNGFTPLLKAIRQGKNNAVAVLLERGADLDVAPKDHPGYNALHVAAQWRNEPAMALLLQYCPELNKQDDKGQAPLHVAALKGALAIVKLLVAAGAAVMPVNNDNETPREVAARIASTTTTTGVEPHFDTARYLQQVEDERGISVEFQRACRAKVERDIAVLKSHHPERFKIKTKLSP